MHAKQSVPFSSLAVSPVFCSSMDVFSATKSSALVSVAHPGKWEPFESLMVQDRVEAFISYMDLSTLRIFQHPIPDWTKKGPYVDNFKRAVLESKKVHFFERRKVEGHVYQTSDAPIMIYHLPAKSLRCKAKPCITRRSFCEIDQFLYDRYVLKPNSTYVVPPGTMYHLTNGTKTLFAVDIMEWDLVKHYQNFKTHKEFTLQVYNLPAPTPAHECEPPAKELKTTFVDPSPVHQTFVETSPVHQTFVEPSPVPETFVEPSPVPETFVQPSPVPEIDFSLERDDRNNFLEIFGRDLFHDSPAAVLPPSHDSPAAVLSPSHDSPAAVLHPSHDSLAAVLPPQEPYLYWQDNLKPFF
ncbi:hypothetical protein HNY73_001644 [Argiope bruennichi]|uniref:Uncharacterized protein n=1 Tax=Argiope bruennichi TaxID=94029 RepID=A0A8T0FRZ3_ARGBR|nr:hypothetical protein HNY73_001644 [Argiope bruennichi]